MTHSALSQSIPTKTTASRPTRTQSCVYNLQMISPNDFWSSSAWQRDVEHRRSAARHCDKSHYNVNMYSVSLGAAGGAQTQNESRQETLWWRRNNHSEHFTAGRRIWASGGLMLRRCHDAICAPSPFIRGCESMRLGDNILPDEICAQSDASPPPPAPPAAPPRRLFWGMKAWDMQWLSFSSLSQFTH